MELCEIFKTFVNGKVKYHLFLITFKHNEIMEIIEAFGIDKEFGNKTWKPEMRSKNDENAILSCISVLFDIMVEIFSRKY